MDLREAQAFRSSRSIHYLLLALHLFSGLSVVGAQTTTAPSITSQASAPSTTARPSVSAVTGCHLHGATQYCMVGTTEYRILTPATATSALPAQYTGCHSHGGEMWCLSPGGEVQVELAEAVAATTTVAEHTGTESHDHTETNTPSGVNCHFHAGVEHCVGANENESGSAVSCARVQRDYNVRLRVGLLFVMLVTSALGVFGPILLTSFSRAKLNGPIFSFLKQFGTGVIFSTAFVHLFTHASLMFASECLGELKYEGTTAAILMAGVFLSFLVEYLGHRFLQWRSARKQSEGDSGTSEPRPADTEVLTVIVLESGIIFHSLLIGLTLVVSGDSFFLTLFVVILFHQLFEGIALGTRIAALSSDLSTSLGSHVSVSKKLFMALAFALTTPVGMAIGIGVLRHFNGNDRATIIAIGTLDALSAGILVWVGLVEMWAHDWIHGPLTEASMFETVIALVGLVAGAAVMSLLGKWA